MKPGLVAAGAISLVAGIVIIGVCAVAVSQATADFMGCLNGFPTSPTIGFPTACTDAMGAITLYGTLEWIGVAVGVIGFVVLLIGLLLPPERPAYAPPAYGYYPPPAYGAPPGVAPPSAPPGPPPQS